MITRRINSFLFRSKNLKKSAVFWNAFSAVTNSFQTMVLLMVLTRCENMDDSGIFVLAFAVGNLMLNVGKFGMRQFQVTDSSEKFCFSTYVQSRLYSTVCMLALSVVYIIYSICFNQYSMKKSFFVILICILKATEAYEDVYHGRMQQKGRLDVAGKILGIRLFVFIAIFAVTYLITESLLLTGAISVVVTLFLAFFFNYSACLELEIEKGEWDAGNVKKLMVECFPLCACMCMNMYIANAPKYIIDAVVDSEIQTCFNIVFMPVFIIALLANFIFQPCLKGLGDIWNEKNYACFVKRIYTLAVLVCMSSIVISGIGAWIGCDVLGFIYGVDLKSYNVLLIIFMFAGGVIALQNLFVIAITVVRYQKYMIYGYTAIALVIFLFGNRILQVFGIVHLSLFFLFAMLLLLCYCIILLAIACRKNKNDKKR